MFHLDTPDNSNYVTLQFKQDCCQQGSQLLTFLGTRADVKYANTIRKVFES